MSSFCQHKKRNGNKCRNEAIYRGYCWVHIAEHTSDFEITDEENEIC